MSSTDRPDRPVPAPLPAAGPTGAAPRRPFAPPPPPPPPAAAAPGRASGAEPPSPAEPAGPAARSPAPGMAKEIGGPKGPEPTRFGDWEKNGRCSDF
ncbi:MAG: DUF1674 domain-containing protein [Alphaproteobacteria bacterium]|nr:DUF1674 domain-containing protein [Alphaproteobacteria bacterium]